MFTSLFYSLRLMDFKQLADKYFFIDQCNTDVEKCETSPTSINKMLQYLDLSVELMKALIKLHI